MCSKQLVVIYWLDCNFGVGHFPFLSTARTAADETQFSTERHCPRQSVAPSETLNTALFDYKNIADVETCFLLSSSCASLLLQFIVIVECLQNSFSLVSSV